MNKYSLFIILFLTLCGCNNEKNHTGDKEQCTVVFTSVDSIANLSLNVYFAPNFEIFRASKDSMGFITFEIPGMKHGVVSIQKSGVSIDVFVTNNDTIKIETLNDGEDISFGFEGNKAPHYNFFRKQKKNISRYQKFSGDIFLYKESCERSFQERKDFLKEYALDNKVSLEFVDYVSKIFKYRYLYELTVPLSKIPIEELHSVGKEYLEDLQVEDFDDNSILKIRTATLALHKYLGYYVTQSYRGYEGGDEFERHFEEITRGLNGRVREYAYTALLEDYYRNLLPNNINLLKKYVKTVRKSVKDTAFLRKLDKINNRLLSLKNPLPDSIKSIRLMGLDDKTTSLGTILEKHKTSTIVVDNWASWCWACLMDMEEAKEFKEQIVKEGIAWIYISIDQEKDIGKWKQTSREKQKLGLMVNQYLVTGDDLKMYNDFFGTTEGIPRYLFFNSKGELSLYKGPRPTDPVTFRKVLDQLKTDKMKIE
ncbi:hypothetical protein OOZ15_01825 [Galbibacter sp. EGI 63066]|uniref:TlpA family protein disulfide reductase n=1 Tax=Galbibacter sp. EGI 63066 TaxID=2993559 RepID=UPI00224895AC|nr:hypothetical protein [Galbibacter sp. EGI 63066]MCX2678668.1 hypothetical protein [Galbibacter sp. EGI 63066]